MPKLLAALTAAVLTVGGCAANTPDYSTIGTRAPTTSSEAEEAPDDRPVPIAEYLASMGVTIWWLWFLGVMPL